MRRCVIDDRRTWNNLQAECLLDPSASLSRSRPNVKVSHRTMCGEPAPKGSPLPIKIILCEGGLPCFPCRFPSCLHFALLQLSLFLCLFLQSFVLLLSPLSDKLLGLLIIPLFTIILQFTLFSSFLCEPLLFLTFLLHFLVFLLPIRPAFIFRIILSPILFLLSCKVAPSVGVDFHVLHRLRVLRIPGLGRCNCRCCGLCMGLRLLACWPWLLIANPS
mmetsp:Transcript_26389/g.63657  ORF Transcript_26389/g.63657 Transcript_26389/m.63657 type:complete len:218 (+) Transcript_26389:190-843(+)